VRSAAPPASASRAAPEGAGAPRAAGGARPRRRPDRVPTLTLTLTPAAAQASWASEQATALAWPGLRRGSGFFGSAFDSPPLSEEWAATGGAPLSASGSGLGAAGPPPSRTSSGLVRPGATGARMLWGRAHGMRQHRSRRE
jgi:hypothetical protein